MPRKRRFSLIELLIVLAAVAIVAAVLSPAFAMSQDTQRSMICLQNMRQIATGLAQYIDDNDERIFFRPVTRRSIGRTRVLHPTFMSAKRNAALFYQEQWYVLLMPYVRSSAIFSCPNDTKPSMSPDAMGKPSIPRSYIVSSAIEDLTLAQVENPGQTIVVTEKWSGPGDTWIDQMDGDMLPQQSDPSKMVVPANRHQGTMNCAFFDGHARWTTPAAIWSSADLSGCWLIHQYPAPAQNLALAGLKSAGLCDDTMPLCGKKTLGYANAVTGADLNLCDAPGLELQY